MSDISQCAIHEKDEPVTNFTHEVCFECGHVYETEADLKKEWDEQFPETKQQGFCPLCLHDLY